MVNVADSFLNKKRVDLIKRICSEESGVKIENALKETFEKVLDNVDEKTYRLVHFISKLDNIHGVNDEDLKSYSLDSKKVHVIKTQNDLMKAVENIATSRIIGFDTEQKPIFEKGVPPSKIAVIQISTFSDCYIFQIHLINDIKPLLELLVNTHIVKVGIGLNGDNRAFHNDFGIRINHCIDFGALFKSKMFHDNDIGAKKSVLLFLDEKLQKSKKMSRSNWESKVLSPSQIKYAGEDAACVYDAFCSMLVQYDFLVEVLPHWFKKEYYNHTYDEILKEFK